MLPKLAEGEANKVFVIPSEFTQAFAGIGDALSPPTAPTAAPPGLPGSGRRRRDTTTAPARHLRREDRGSPARLAAADASATAASGRPSTT